VSSRDIYWPVYLGNHLCKWGDQATSPESSNQPDVAEINFIPVFELSVAVTDGSGFPLTRICQQ